MAHTVESLIAMIPKTLPGDKAKQRRHHYPAERNRIAGGSMERCGQEWECELWQRARMPPPRSP